MKMSSDESFTSREYDTPDRSQHSSPLLDDCCDDDEFEHPPVNNRRRILLEKLPSPREFKSPPEKIPSPPPKKFVSISELNPFFDELDTTCSSTSSVADDGEGAQDSHDLRAPLEVHRQDRPSSPESQKAEGTPLCRRTSSFRKIWSSLGSSNLPGLPSAVLTKSQESCYSSSGSNEGLEKSKKSIKNRLRHVSNKVRKQFSVTSGFIAEKLANKHTVKSDSSLEAFPGESREFHENHLRTASPEQQPPEQPTHTPVSHSKIDTNNLQRLEEYKERKSSARSNGSGVNEEHIQIEPAKLIWSIPNWTDNEAITTSDNNSLEEEIEKEKKAIAQRHPMEWAESIEYLRKSVGRDFRRGYLALGEKMQLPNLQAVRCVKFSQFHSFLAIGCEEGTLLILELDYQKPLHQLLKSHEDLQNLLYQFPLRSKCRIQMNETLVGHAYDLKCIEWNNVNGKLVTSDEAGVILGWGFGEKGCWVEEFINDRSTSRICDISWSPDGKKIAIGYEDFSGNGKVTGGLIVGFANGTQIFDRKFSDSQINAVVWYNDSTVWVIVDFLVYTFDEKGEPARTQLSIEISAVPTELISFMMRPKSSWIKSENVPEFAVVYKDSCMALYSSFSDKAPIRIHTQITSTCADWSANGVYIVIGGISVSSGDGYFSPQTNLYNYEGKLLQILKLPEHSITSISWDPDSLHLTIASDRHIYFANLRPLYKIASSKNSHCYAYTVDYISQWIAIWNEKTFFRERIPGKVIDIKSFNDKFGVLCMDSLGVYHIFVFAESGVKEHHLCVITMEPFALTMTKNSVICLAQNAVLNWNYNLSGNNGESQKKFTGALKPTRQVHIDEFPGIIVKPGEKQNHLLKPTMDAARCMHAMRDRLCVARESGKLNIYALPTLGFLQTYRLDLEGDICQEIKFNNNGTQLALLTMNGHLRICRFPEARERRKDAAYCGQELELLYCENLLSVSGMMWATDLPQHICVLEGNSLHILQDDQIIETMANIPSGCYLTSYEGLHITLIYMDKVIESPENPSEKMVIKLPSPSLSRLNEAVEHGECVDDVVSLLQTSSYSHPVLRKIVGDEALRQGEIGIAENIYNEDKNYRAIRFLENIKDSELEIQKAQIHSFLEEYEQAQHYFIRARRKDLAIKMWKDLGDWEKVSFLSGYKSEDSSTEALQNQFEKFSDAHDWEMAFDISLKLEDLEKTVDCCIMMQDYEKLILLMEKLPQKDPLLLKIGKFLASNGFIDESAYCFSAHGNPETAMALAMDTRNWDLAMKLSGEYNLPLIQPALVKHVRTLVAQNQLNSAIQVLERCGKIITAGKLLIWKGLLLLRRDTCDTMQVKKIFVLAALMLSKKKCREKKRSRPNNTRHTNESDELDLEFLIPKEHLEMMTGHNEWCWSDPWRGAEAIHFLNLTQRFIYRGMMGRAFKAAMYLKKFEDIIGFERMNCLIALSAINNGYFKVASNSLLKLEGMDEKEDKMNYSEISFNLFKDHPPKNHEISATKCPGCNESIPDFYHSCPSCNMQFTMCIFSACPIANEMDMWTCQTCLRSVEHAKRDRFDFCLLCHSQS